MIIFIGGEVKLQLSDLSDTLHDRFSQATAKQLFSVSRDNIVDYLHDPLNYDNINSELMHALCSQQPFKIATIRDLISRSSFSNDGLKEGMYEEAIRLERYLLGMVSKLINLAQEADYDLLIEWDHLPLFTNRELGIEGTPLIKRYYLRGGSETEGKPFGNKPEDKCEPLDYYVMTHEQMTRFRVRQELMPNRYRSEPTSYPYISCYEYIARDDTEEPNSLETECYIDTESPQTQLQKKECGRTVSVKILRYNGPEHNEQCNDLIMRDLFQN